MADVIDELQIDEEEIKKRLIKTVEQVFDDANEIRLTAERTDVVGWDSLGNLRLMMAVEEEFDILFDEDDFEKMTSIKSLYEAVLAKLQQS